MKRSRLAIAAAVVVVATLAGGGIAVAAGGDDDAGDMPITGEAYDQASAAALDHLGEGSVTETEVGDEESYYEVEVTLDNGHQVDVQLDRDFNVVGTEDDGAGDNEDTD